MEQLKSMKQCLIAQAQTQMGNLQNTDAKELGEVIDMIKDLEEAIYYCTVTKAMEDKDEKEMEEPKYYTLTHPREAKYPEYYRDMDRNWGKLYYTETPGTHELNNYTRDYREGRSPMSRKMYMESKELHKDKNTQMRELEKYMSELSGDLTEIIEDATPEEKQILKQKMMNLMNLI